ncbi:MAG: permease prefix domain 1-containing protein [Armatimonadota bacterium]
MDYLKRFERELDISSVEKKQVVKEMSAHIEEMKEDVMSKGLSAEDAEAVVARKLGNPAKIAARLGAIHERSGWKSMLLSILPFLGVVPILMMILGTRNKGMDGLGTLYFNRPLVLVGGALVILLSITMLVIGIREILHNKRPSWLASFLAASMFLPLVAFIKNKYAPMALTRSHFDYTDSGDGFSFSPYWHEILYSCFYWIICVSVLVIIFALLRDGKWKLLTISALFAIALGARLVVFNIDINLALLSAVMFVIAGLVVFAKHRYSTTSRASLFLFVGYVFFMIAFANDIDPDNSKFIVITRILSSAVATILLYLRAANKWTKYMVILCGTVIINITDYLWKLSPQAGQSLLSMAVITVMIPILFEIRTKRSNELLVAD